MDLGALLLVAAVAVVVGLYVFMPYGERTARRVTRQEHNISALMAERDSILTALQELEMDHLLGKIPAEDYPTQRAALMKAGVDVLKELDALTGKTDDRSAENRMEEAARTQAAAAEAAVGEDDLEALIAKRRAQRRRRSAGFCPQCGRAVLEKDRFCAHCGYVLKS